MSTVAKTQDIANLLAIEQEYPAPPIVAQNCRQQNFSADCQRALENPESFWGDYAKNFTWSRLPRQVIPLADGVEWQAPS